MAQKPTVILTGASRGIGHATVKRFSKEGWRVVTCSREDIPDNCRYDPNWTHHIPTDLSNHDSVSHFIEKTREILGESDMTLLDNAALSPKTPLKKGWDA